MIAFRLFTFPGLVSVAATPVPDGERYIIFGSVVAAETVAVFVVVAVVVAATAVVVAVVALVTTDEVVVLEFPVVVEVPVVHILPVSTHTLQLGPGQVAVRVSVMVPVWFVGHGCVRV
jgi:hypothetical protein